MAASRKTPWAKPIPITGFTPREMGYSSHHAGSPEHIFQFDDTDAWSTNPSIYNQAGIVPSVQPNSRKAEVPNKWFRPRKANDNVVGATAMSLPVNIPNSMYYQEGTGDEEQDGKGSEWIPPHEYLARRWGATTLSVHEGVGRTLKGRDLRQVRNAVWKKVGFED